MSILRDRVALDAEVPAVHVEPTPLGARLRQAFDRHMSKIVVAPSAVILMVIVYGFILWTIYISFSASRMTPDYGFVGPSQYVAVEHAALVYRHNMLIFGGCPSLASHYGGADAGVFRPAHPHRSAIRTIYLYPMAPFIVTGTAWKWISTPAWVWKVHARTRSNVNFD